MKTIKELEALDKELIKYNPTAYHLYRLGVTTEQERVLGLMKEIEDNYALCGGAWNELKKRIKKC